MKIESILKDTNYNIKIFDNEEIKRLEENISEHLIKDSKVFKIKCLIRNYEIKATPEELIRQLYLDKLINKYKYPKKLIQLEYGVHFGRQVKRADIVIFDKDSPDSVFIIVELKKPKLKDGKEQLRSYCNATGAPIGVWTNGEQIEFYHRRDPNYFTNLFDLPIFTESFSEFLNKRNRFTYLDLILNDKLQKQTLKQIIEELEDEVLSNAGVDAFEEPFKLIFTKLYDEKKHQDDLKIIEVWLDAKGIKSIYDLNDNENKELRKELNQRLQLLEFRDTGTEDEVKERIEELFIEAQQKWKGIFQDGTKLELSKSHTKIVVSYLQNIKLFNSNLEIIDEAFEYLVNKNNKGEKGQYFTPRYVIDMCVNMLNPKPSEFIIDTASGSCGFPVHTIFYNWRKLNPNENHLFTAEEKTQEQIEYVRNKVFAIDFDKKTVRVGRTLNLIAGDGETNVLHMNTLDYERWNELKNDREWYRTYQEGFEKLEDLRVDKIEKKGIANYKEFKFDIVMANPPFAGDIKDQRIISKYELGEKEKGWHDKVSRDILFVERNLQFLKPGGRMAIVLPQGRFNNTTDKFLRDYIAKKCRILGVVGLHVNTFKPHTGTKTSVLLLQKWNDDPTLGPLCPYKENYNIFFATQRSRGKDNSGEKLYKSVDGGETIDPKEAIKDKWGHFIVSHDLFNHNKFILDDGTVIDNGETQDGIAEAFEEFAKKEGLSFF
ncbi:N-6 DNA methylase [Fredinandcohnia salidurans]|uniref:N-6 DNA methylase n=1 Tax=Fredinandcohnia salidurans TaxID=2595041 RepID=A0ABW4MUR1_9BACI